MLEKVTPSLHYMVTDKVLCLHLQPVIFRVQKNHLFLSTFTYRTRAIKGRDFYSKISFSALHNSAFYKPLFIFIIRHCTKILYNTHIFGSFLGVAYYLRGTIIGVGTVTT